MTEIDNLLCQRQTLLEELKNNQENLQTISKALLNCLQNGGKILIAGNGGSAAVSSHFASEILGKFKRERNGYPALSLTSDMSVFTSLANDYGFDQAMAKSIEAFAGKSDVFIATSTSGNSENIIKGLIAAKQRGILTISLLGKGGGRQKGMADYEIIIPSYDTAQIQEAHLTLLHIMAELVEKGLK